MPVLLSRRQARLAAMACRALIAVLEGDIRAQGNPVIADGKRQSVAKLRELERLFERHAALPRGSNRG